MWTYNYTYQNELYHHGVPDMKWGIRKARQLIGGAARARSGQNGGYGSTTLRREVGLALIGRNRKPNRFNAYGMNNIGPRRETGLRRLAANTGRKMIGRKTISGPHSSFVYNRGNKSYHNNIYAEIARTAISRTKVQKTNIGGPEFRRLSRSKITRNVVNKALNKHGTDLFGDKLQGYNLRTPEGRGGFNSRNTLSAVVSRGILSTAGLNSRKGSNFRRLR